VHVGGEVLLLLVWGQVGSILTTPYACLASRVDMFWDLGS
jgi:hypothetical protein